MLLLLLNKTDGNKNEKDSKRGQDMSKSKGFIVNKATNRLKY